MRAASVTPDSGSIANQASPRWTSSESTRAASRVPASVGAVDEGRRARLRHRGHERLERAGPKRQSLRCLGQPSTQGAGIGQAVASPRLRGLGRQCERGRFVARQSIFEYRRVEDRAGALGQRQRLVFRVRANDDEVPHVGRADRFAQALIAQLVRHRHRAQARQFVAPRMRPARTARRSHRARRPTRPDAIRASDRIRRAPARRPVRRP